MDWFLQWRLLAPKQKHINFYRRTAGFSLILLEGVLTLHTYSSLLGATV